MSSEMGDIVRAAMPGTTEQLQRKTGLSDWYLRTTIEALRRLEIVHVGGWLPNPRGGRRSPIWHDGPGVNVPLPDIRIEILATMPATQAQVAAKLHLTVSIICRLMKVLVENGDIEFDGFELTGKRGTSPARYRAVVK